MGKISSLLLIVSIGFIMGGCGDSKQTKTESKEVQPAHENKTANETTGNLSELTAPDFNDQARKEYYSSFTSYLKKVVTSIQNKDEEGTMNIFRQESARFNNKNEMDQEAQAAEKDKFNSWLMQTIPYQKIIVESDYYKKYNEEYNKKVKEKFKEKGY
jgi:PBP1b-binding outer membrane lipoprotein LpoB